MACVSASSPVDAVTPRRHAHGSGAGVDDGGPRAPARALISSIFTSRTGSVTATPPRDFRARAGSRRNCDHRNPPGAESARSLHSRAARPDCRPGSRPIWPVSMALPPPNAITPSALPAANQSQGPRSTSSVVGSAVSASSDGELHLGLGRIGLQGGHPRPGGQHAVGHQHGALDAQVGPGSPAAVVRGALADVDHPAVRESPGPGANRP